MKLRILAVSAVAVVCGMGGAYAQSAASPAGGAGMLCSDLTAMDSASQTAFLQGYWAGHQDATGASSAASADTAAAAGAAGTTGAAGTAGAATSTETAAAGTTTGAAGAGATAGADPTATGSTAAGGTTTGSMAAGGSMAGEADFASILTKCQESPTSPISSMLMSTP